jgi:hypothetical protein
MTKLLFFLGNLKLWFIGILLQITPADNFIKTYLFSDLSFLKWLFIASGLDLLTGIAKAYKNKQPITSRAMRDTITKIIQYGAFLIITHVLTHYQIDGQSSKTLEWVNKLAMEYIILVEIKSVYENIVAINPKFDFVSALWKKLVKMFPVKDQKS